MPRWKIKNSTTVEWTPALGDKHTDDIEMAGFLAVDVVTYGVDEGGFRLCHHPVFPTLRLRPNDTRASYQRDVGRDELPMLLIDGQKERETLTRAELDGTLLLVTRTDNAEITRRTIPRPTSASSGRKSL